MGRLKPGRGAGFPGVTLCLSVIKAEAFYGCLIATSKEQREQGRFNLVQAVGFRSSSHLRSSRLRFSIFKKGSGYTGSPRGSRSRRFGSPLAHQLSLGPVFQMEEL